MSTRNAFIAPLDAALNEALVRCDKGDAAIAAFLAEHIGTIDAYHALQSARVNAYGDAHGIEGAIRKLGYVVLDADGRVVPATESRLTHIYSAHDDETAARKILTPTDSESLS